MSYSYTYKANNGRQYSSFASENVYDTPLPISLSTAVSYALLLIGAVFYLVQRSGTFPLLSIPELLWNGLVYITPPSLLLLLDKQGAAALAAEKEDQGIYAVSRTFGAKSEAMRRVLGLDGNGLLTGLQQSRGLPRLSSALVSPSSKSLPGLGNWDNSCYQNSVIQGLASLPALTKFLNMADSDLERDAVSTRGALMDIVAQLNDPKSSGQRLWTPPPLKNMSSWQQQDAQEYYSKVIDELEKEVSSSLRTVPENGGLVNVAELVLPAQSTKSDEQSQNKEGTTLKAEAFNQPLASVAPIRFRNPLEGLLAQRVGCLKCGLVEGLSLIPFNCLTVPLGRQTGYTIETCLNEYTTLEPISGVECANCTLLKRKRQLDRILSQRSTALEDGNPIDPSAEDMYTSVQSRLDAVNTAISGADFSEATLTKKCMIPSRMRVTTTKSRQAVIARAPESLVLHVNRSIFDEYSGIQSKNYANVRFPKSLDLAPWCLGSTSIAGDEAIEKWETNPAKSMLTANGDRNITLDDSVHFGTRRASRSQPYALRAVVTHYGRHENGHYIAYRQDPQETQSKDTVDNSSSWWRLSDEEVSRVDEEEVLAQGGVFMLFYEQIECSDNIPEREDQNIPTPATSTLESESSDAIRSTFPEPQATEQDPSKHEPKTPQTATPQHADAKIPKTPSTAPPTPLVTQPHPSSPSISPPSYPSTKPSQLAPATQNTESRLDVREEIPRFKERPTIAPLMRTAGDAARQVDCMDTGGGMVIQAN